MGKALVEPKVVRVIAIPLGSRWVIECGPETTLQQAELLADQVHRWWESGEPFMVMAGGGYVLRRVDKAPKRDWPALLRRLGI